MEHEIEIRPVILHHYLRNHPEGDVHFEAWTVGFSLGMKEDFDKNLISKEIRNVINSKVDLLEMLDRLIKELEKGYIISGLGMYQLNLLIVPNQDAATGLLTKKREARHASFAGPGKISLNDAMTQQSKEMKGALQLPSFFQYLFLFILSNFLSLRDLKDAFRQLLLAPEDVGVVQYRARYTAAQVPPVAANNSVPS